MAKVGISVTAKTKGVAESLNKVSGSLNKINKDMGSWYNHTRKLNQRFVNLNKDANRTANGIGKLVGSLKKLAGTASIIALGSSLAKMVNATIESIETTNLFNVALGDMSDKAMEAVNQLHELYGLDVTNLKNSVATYALLAKSMGMTSEQAEVLGTNVTRMAIDLSSLMNVPVQQVMADLRSGLLGQSETVYKYGMDVTEAGVKEEAFALGIEKSVRNMNQGEKMALRYSKMIRTVSKDLGDGNSVIGDFGRTIETPANQLKILAERFVTLSRSIGTIFIPILQQVLPYLNALVKVLITVVDSIASFFGYTEDLTGGKFGDGVKSLEEDADNASDAVDGVTDSMKKLKKMALGIDELNSFSDSSNDDNSTSIIPDFKMPSLVELDDMIKTRTDSIVSTITGQLNKLKKALSPTTKALKKLWDEGLSKLSDYVGTNLVNFYNDFLVPVGDWTLGKGLPSLLSTTNNLLTEVDWDKLSGKFSELNKALAPFATTIGQGLLDFYEKFCVPIAKWTLNEGLPKLIDVLKDFIENVNITPLVDALGNLWEKLAPFVTAVGDGLISFIKSLAEFLTPALNKILAIFSDLINALADGIGSISEDTAVAIGGAVGGIASAFLMFLGAKAVGAILISLAEGAVAIIGAIINHPLLVLAFGVSALAGALVALADHKFETSEIGIYVDKVDKLVKSSKDLNTEVDKMLERHEQRRSDIESEYGAVEILADRYMELVKQSSLTNDEKLLMKSYADELIQKIPELRDLINEETGAYKGTEDQIRSLITKTKEYYLVQAAQESLIEIAKAQYEEQKKLKELTDERKIAEDKLAKVEDVKKTRYDQLIQKYKDAHGGMISQVEEGKILIQTEQEMNKEVKELRKVLEKLDGQIKESTTKQSELSTQWDYATDYISNYSSTAQTEIPKVTSTVDTELSKISTKVKNFSLPKLMIEVGVNMPDSFGNLKGIYDEAPPAFAKGGFVKSYATGGFPDFGDLFIANDGAPELVGHIGNQTAVVNQDQIVEAVSQGVANAVASVMGSASGNATVIENILHLDGEVVYTNQQKIAKNRGLDFGMGVFAR